MDPWWTRWDPNSSSRIVHLSRRRIHRSFPNLLSVGTSFLFKSGVDPESEEGFPSSTVPTLSNARRGTSLWSPPDHVDPFSSSIFARFLSLFIPSHPTSIHAIGPCAVEHPFSPGAGPCHVAPRSPPLPPHIVSIDTSPSHRYLFPISLRDIDALSFLPQRSMRRLEGVSHHDTSRHFVAHVTRPTCVERSTKDAS